MVGGTDQGQPQTQQQQLHLGRDDTASVTVNESEFFPDGGSLPHASAFIFLLGPVFCPGVGPIFPLLLMDHLYTLMGGQDCSCASHLFHIF